jgi:hypothetical protein
VSVRVPAAAGAAPAPSAAAAAAAARDPLAEERVGRLPSSAAEWGAEPAGGWANR